MHLYISKHLRDTVTREEVWEEINKIHDICGKVFIRASLLPIPFQPRWPRVDRSAVLVYTRKNGRKHPIKLYYICNKEYPLYPERPLTHLIPLYWFRLDNEDIPTYPGHAEETLPPRLKAALTQ